MTLWIHAPVECYHRPQCHSFFASTMKTSFVAALLLPFLLGAPAWAAEQTMIRTILVTVGDGPAVTASLAENASAQALARALSQGDITYEADDYGGFEKVGDIGRSLPRNDEPITSRPGDILLYEGSRLCFFIGANSWDYTRIGRLEGLDRNALRRVLRAGEGRVRVKLSLDPK